MVKRKIINIDEDKCNGCGLCIPNCPEGAIQIIDDKARLISDLFCDGLGACIGHCPEGAITIEEREAEAYDERKVMENIAKQGENTIRAHLEHLEEHGEKEFLKEAVDYLNEKGIKIKKVEKKENLLCGCPGSAMREIKPMEEKGDGVRGDSVKTDSVKVDSVKQESKLTQWPVQLNLLPSQAPFFNDSDLLVCADCVPFAYPNFHSDLLDGKSLVIGCPKLDDIESYKEKMIEMFKLNNVKSVTVAIMEVPCCYGLHSIVEGAVKESGKDIEVIKKVISVSGGIS